MEIIVQAFISLLQDYCNSDCSEKYVYSTLIQNAVLRMKMNETQAFFFRVLNPEMARSFTFYLPMCHHGSDYHISCWRHKKQGFGPKCRPSCQSRFNKKLNGYRQIHESKASKGQTWVISTKEQTKSRKVEKCQNHKVYCLHATN